MVKILTWHVERERIYNGIKVLVEGQSYLEVKFPSKEQINRVEEEMATFP